MRRRTTVSRSVHPRRNHVHAPEFAHVCVCVCSVCAFTWPFFSLSHRNHSYLVLSYANASRHTHTRNARITLHEHITEYVCQILILFFDSGICRHWCGAFNQRQIRRNDAGKRNQRHSININAMCIRLSLMAIIGFAEPQTVATQRMRSRCHNAFPFSPYLFTYSSRERWPW